MGSMLGAFLLVVMVGVIVWMASSGGSRRTETVGPRPRRSPMSRTPPGAASEDAHAAAAPDQFRCLVCGGDRFEERQALMNTAMATFFNFDWANRSAACLVCCDCGYVHWFLPPDSRP